MCDQQVRCLVIGGRVVSSVMKMGKRGFACAETTLSASRPIGIRQGTEWIALEAAHALKLDVASVDLLLENGRLKVSNVSACPDLGMLEAVSGLDLCSMLLEYATIRAGRWAKRVGGSGGSGAGSGNPSSSRCCVCCGCCGAVFAVFAVFAVLLCCYVAVLLWCCDAVMLWCCGAGLTHFTAYV